MNQTYEETVEQFEFLIFQQDPFLALNIRVGAGEIPASLVHEKADVLLTIAFGLYQRIPVGEGYTRYEAARERIEQNRESALRHLSGTFKIEDQAANAKRIIGMFTKRGLYFWNPWLDGVIFAIIAAITTFGAQALVAQPGIIMATTATLLNLLVLGVAFYALVFERRALTLFAAFAGTFPLAVVHYLDAVGMLIAVRTEMTPTGNALVAPFAGLVGGLLALGIIRTVSQNGELDIPGLVRYLEGSASPASVKWNPAKARNPKRNRAYVMGGVAAGATLALGVWATIYSQDKTQLTEIQIAKGQIFEDLQASQSESAGLRSRVSSLERYETEASSLRSEVSTLQNEITELTEQVDGLTKERDAERQKNASLTTEMAALKEKLAFVEKITTGSMSFSDGTSYGYGMTVGKDGSVNMSRKESYGIPSYANSTWVWAGAKSIRFAHPFKASVTMKLTDDGGEQFTLQELSEEGSVQLFVNYNSGSPIFNR